MIGTRRKGHSADDALWCEAEARGFKVGSLVYLVQRLRDREAAPKQGVRSVPGD